MTCQRVPSSEMAQKSAARSRAGGWIHKHACQATRTKGRLVAPRVVGQGLDLEEEPAPAIEHRLGWRVLGLLAVEAVAAGRDAGVDPLDHHIDEPPPLRAL